MNNHLNKPLPHSINSWDHRFAFFWYNDEEILHDSDAEIERKVNVFASQGINHLITFSCTHFRWSFMRYKDKINDALARIVRACHKNNIYLTEHHSSNLTYYPIDDSARNFFETSLRKRKCSLDNWPELYEDCLSAPVMGDDKMSSFLQVDGETGLPAFINTYKARAMCFNNPGFVKNYLRYLESVYDCGIDGIMTDDAEYFENTCACDICRTEYHEKYGFELPPPAEWKKWHGNFHDPSYRAWIDFRKESVRKFHLKVKAHYEALGLNLLRPNYIAHALNLNPYAYCFDKLPALDWAFQECCYSTIIKYSWPSYLVEQIHRRKVAEKRNIPPMIMFYADREDTLNFAWGLAKLSGSLFTNTPEGEAGCSEEKIRCFEKKYHDIFFDTQKISQLAFYDSMRNRELNPEYYASRMKFWMQSCLFENIPFDMTDGDLSSHWNKYKLIVLNETALLEDHEILLLSSYVNNGGTLAVSGMPGIFDDNGNKRDLTALNKLWGFRLLTPEELVNDFSEINFGKGKIFFINTFWGYPGEDSFKKEFFIDKKNSGTSEFISYCWNNMREISDAWANKWTMDKITAKYDGKYQGSRSERKQVATFIRSILAVDNTVSFENFPELLLAVPFMSKTHDELIIHMLNASKCFDIEKGRAISHDDLIQFESFDDNYAAIIIDLKHCGMNEKRVQSEFLCLRQNGPIKLINDLNNSKIRVEFPLSMIKDYGVVKISMTK